MPAFENDRREAFAQALVDGVPPLRASRQVGYTSRGFRARERAAHPDMVRRLEEIVAERAGGRSRDVANLIEVLVAGAQIAKGVGSIPALTAMRGLVVEAARLKALLPTPPVYHPIAPEMTEEEWLAMVGGYTDIPAGEAAARGECE